ncbi:uncharacterized protein LOC105022675 [Esox lucius]|uniref:Uncharacterized protein n=1 Tax=Esox lucius TaxID=8010 RepID=A0A3P9A1U8_ESOLU|nr:uncharacterized protein LOC105022675 [Esox lucius]
MFFASTTTAPVPFNTMGPSKSSRSSGNCRKLVIAILILWSLVSLIVIIVWATSTHIYGVAQCKLAQQALTDKIEGAKVMWEKDQKFLQEVIWLSQENQTALKQEMEDVAERLRETNVSLSLSLQENAMLLENETALRNYVGLQRNTQIHLSLVLGLHRDKVERLQFNLTQTLYQSRSCSASSDASKSQKVAAMSQRKACESSKQYLLTDMKRRGCQIEEVNL